MSTRKAALGANGEPLPAARRELVVIGAQCTVPSIPFLAQLPVSYARCSPPRPLVSFFLQSVPFHCSRPTWRLQRALAATRRGAAPPFKGGRLQHCQSRHLLALCTSSREIISAVLNPAPAQRRGLRLAALPRPHAALKCPPPPSS